MLLIINDYKHTLLVIWLLFSVSANAGLEKITLPFGDKSVTIEIISSLPDCPVCFEPTNKQVDCGHTLCENCYKKLTANKECPECRKTNRKLTTRYGVEENFSFKCPICKKTIAYEQSPANQEESKVEPQEHLHAHSTSPQGSSNSVSSAIAAFLGGVSMQPKDIDSDEEEDDLLGEKIPAAPGDLTVSKSNGLDSQQTSVSLNKYINAFNSSASSETSLGIFPTMEVRRRTGRSIQSIVDPINWTAS